MFVGLDPMYWVFVGPAILLALWAQLRIKAAFATYSRVMSSRGMTGAQAAARVLDAAGVNDVSIERVDGFLSDHYDPRSKTLRLSSNVYASPSVAAVGVAAHEAGHAIQHAHNYAPLALRSFMVPLAGFGSNLAIPLIFIGLIMGSIGLVKAGIVLFGVLVAFQLITLPVEFNASSRAKIALAQTGVISSREEMEGVQSVLGAAAWTYVAAAISSILTLLYYLFRLGLLGGRDD
ncbi:MAG TPA: zinc metallopeptidase [Candidatus Brocadiia bacterium]|nr:zinc metallopeptidase [Candidatus Brocadiia bacterium]